MSISYQRLPGLGDEQPSSTIPYSDDILRAVRAADANNVTTVPARRGRSGGRKLPTKAAGKMAAQNGSVMIDKTAEAVPVKVYTRIFGIDFPEYIKPWMVYGGTAAIVAAVLWKLLGGGKLDGRTRRRLQEIGAASNPGPLGWMLGEVAEQRNGRAGGKRRGDAGVAALEKHRNPDVRRAAAFRREFHWGIPARSARIRQVSEAPKVAVELGELTAVTYKTNKRGEKAQFFFHEFEGRKPRLAMDIKNKRLHVVGGSYTVKAAGITG